MMKTFKLFQIFVLAALSCASIQNAIAGPKAKNLKIAFKSDEIKKLSSNRVDIIRLSYIRFLSDLEKRKSDHSVSLNFIFPSAFASNEVCFFGGWESHMAGGKCKNPGSKTCDEGGFQCSPTLFPSGDGSTGVCVEASTYAGLTDRCADASSGQIDYLRNNSNADSLAKLGTQIETFCKSNSQYDACDSLANRLEAVGIKIDITPARAPAPVTNVDNGNKTVAPVVSNPSVGDQVLQQCNENIKSNNLSSSNVFAGCSAAPASPLQKNLSTAKDALTKIDFARSIVGQGTGVMLFAALANKAKYDKLDDSYLDTFKSKYPALAARDDFQSIVNQAKTKLANSGLAVIDQPSAIAAFNANAAAVNAECSDINKKYEAQFDGEASKLRQVWNEYVYTGKDRKEFSEKHSLEMRKKFQAFADASPIATLMATDHFRNKVTDPSVDFGLTCGQQRNYQAIKPINKADLDKGIAETDEIFNKELAKLNSDQKTLASGQVFAAETIIADKLTNYQGIAYAAMQSASSDGLKASYASLMCDTTISLLKSKKYKGYLDKAVTAAALAGGALCLTGIGCAIGAPLALAAGVYGVGTAVQDYATAAALQSASRTNLAAGISKFDQFQLEQRGGQQQKNSAVVSGSLNAIALALPILKLKVSTPTPSATLVKSTTSVKPVTAAKQLPSANVQAQLPSTQTPLMLNAPKPLALPNAKAPLQLPPASSQSLVTTGSKIPAKAPLQLPPASYRSLATTGSKIPAKYRSIQGASSVTDEFTDYVLVSSRTNGGVRRALNSAKYYIGKNGQMILVIATATASGAYLTLQADPSDPTKVKEVFIPKEELA